MIMKSRIKLFFILSFLFLNNAAAEEKTDSMNRVKRQANPPPPPPPLNCTNLQSINAEQLQNNQLCNINPEVFMLCTNSFYERTFTFSQMKCITDNSIKVMGSPCQWSRKQVMDNAIIVASLNISHITCLNYSDVAIFRRIGMEAAKIVDLPTDKMRVLAKLYFDWNGRLNISLPDQIEQMRGIACGLNISTFQGMNDMDLKRVMPFLSNSSCYSPEVKQFMHQKINSLMGPMETWSPKNISDWGSFIGMITNISNMNPSNIPFINPRALQQMTPNVIKTFSPNQILMMNKMQAMAIPDESISSLMPDQVQRIMMLRNGSVPFSNISIGLTRNTLLPIINGSGNTLLPFISGSVAGNTLLPFISGSVAGISGLPPTNDSVEASTQMGEEVSGLPGTLAANIDNNQSTIVNIVVTPVTTPKPSAGAVAGNLSVSTAAYRYSSSNADSSSSKSATAAVNDISEKAMTENNQDNTGSPTVNPTDLQSDMNTDVITGTFPTAAPSDNLATIPAVIDSKNIDSVLSGGQMSSNDVQKISSDALNSPAVLSSLNNLNLDPSLESALKDKIGDMLASKPFDPNLYAACGGMLPQKALKSLTQDQALSVAKEPGFTPDPDTIAMYGQKVGSLLNTITPSQLGEKLQEARKVIQGIPPLQFSGLLSKTTIDSKFINNFQNVTLTDKQSRDIFQKFMSDTKSSLNQSSSEVLAFANSIPACMRGAIPADQISNLNPADALQALKVIAPPSKTSDTDAPAIPSPTLLTLVDKIQKWDKPADISFALENNLLTVKIVKSIKDLICSIITDKSREDKAYDLIILNAIMDECRPSLGQIGKSGSKEYGVLSRVITPSDIKVMSPDFALTTTIPKMCSSNIDPSQMSAILDLLESHFNKSNEFSLRYKQMSCFLPLTKHVNQVQKQSDIDNMCQMIACQQCDQLPSSSFRISSDFCRKNTNSRNLICKSRGTSCFLGAMPLSTLNGTFTRDNILPNLDLLQASIVDCSSRAYIYNAIKPYNLSVASNIIKLGTLLDQLSEDEWKFVDQKTLCGLMLVFKKIYTQWDNLIGNKISAGLRKPIGCDRSLVLKKLIEADTSPACTGTAAGRKKRQTTTVTCNQIQQLGSSVTSLSASQLGSLSNDDFSNCVNVLGKTSDFSQEQISALVTIAKKVYGSDVSVWTTETIISMGGLCSGLLPAELATLKLSKIEAVAAIAFTGYWSSEKLASVFKSVKINLLNSPANLGGLTSAQLKSFGDVICGATADDLGTINPATFCDAIQNVGQVTMCESNQLLALGSVFKNTGCLKTDVSSWKISDISSLGNLIGGLTKSDLSQLTTAQISAIRYQSIDKISPLNFNGFTVDQLKSFTPQQAAVITPDQFNSLDPNKQAAVKSLLSSYASDITMDLKTISTKNAAMIKRSGIVLSMIAITLALFGNC